MSLDIKYRPINYSDVVGQETTIKILRKIVSSGKGFHQSYLFTGQYGSGKTTLARILARALLCSDPKDGNPCNICESCVDIINTGGSECLTEVDAATNSGKESIRQMIDLLSYSTFSGKRRLWILDESHMLSRDASDSILKVLEDTSYGTQERKMVCIFCTTEPERMKETIGSRCGPTFTIRPADIKSISNRLKMICDSEGIKYELEAIENISERTSGHIRDAIKLVESLSLMGDVNKEAVLNYYGVNLINDYLNILYSIREINIGSVESLMNEVSPSTLYDTLSKYCIQCYQVSRGMIQAPRYHDASKMKLVGDKHGLFLLELAEKFSSRPKRLTSDMVICDFLVIQNLCGQNNKIIDSEKKLCNNKNWDGKVSVLPEMSEEEFLNTLSGRIRLEMVSKRQSNLIGPNT